MLGINKKSIIQLQNNIQSNESLNSIETIIFKSTTLQPNPFIIKKKKKY
jgi:hypothetical protein